LTAIWPESPWTISRPLSRRRSRPRRRARDAGEDVAYIHSVFEPASGHCMCFFEAGDAGTVTRVNDEAHLPYNRVSEVLDLTP
jgi:hypothetical protein